MSTSPFSTTEAFNNAIAGPTEGAIYTFAHRPSVNHMALAIASGIFIWFLYQLLSRKAAKPSRFHQSLSQLVNAVVKGLLSVVTAGKRPRSAPAKPADEAQ
mgnify:CR=1 FL=1